MDTMKRPDLSGVSTFIPKNIRKRKKRERLDLPTNIRNTKRSFEVGLNCLDPGNDWNLEGVKEVAITAITKFISAFQKDIGEVADAGVAAKEKAYKERSKVLSTMMHKLQTAEPGDIMIYVFGGNNIVEIPKIRYLKKGSELLFLKGNGDEFEEILEFTKEPKIFSILYKAMIKILGESYLPIKVSQPDKALVVLQIAQFLITAGNIYTSIRSPDCLINEREKEAFFELQRPAIELSPEFKSELLELKRDIEDNKLPYVKEWNDAVRRITDRSLNFRDSDYYSSVKGSASTSQDYGRLPASLASAYEIDVIKDISVEFDELTGYVSHYRDVVPNAKTLVGKTLTIDQNKIKRRVIHIFSNGIQDRMKLIERLLSSVTASLPSDCTKNQRLGVQAAMLWTSRSYREENDNPAVACMDLSNATDNLSREFQQFVLELVLPNTLVDWWQNVTSLQKEYQFYSYEAKNYDQFKGQPQGLLSSFSAFALAHHVIMLLTIRKLGLQEYRASAVYRLLGDDSIINSVEGGINGNLIVPIYTSNTRSVGWPVELDKSHITYFEDENSFAEFAKVTVLDGVIVTPPPFRLLSQIVGAADRGTREFAFCVWLAKHGYAGSNVLDAYIDRWTEGERKEAFSILVKGGIVPFLREFSDLEFSQETDLWKNIAIEYLRSVIKESIVDSALNEREMASLDYMDAYVKKTSAKSGNYKGLSEIDLLEKLTDNLPVNHKLFYFLQRNSHIEDAVKSITGLDSSKVVISSLELTEDEISAILSVDSILQLRDIGILDIDQASLSDILRKLEGLERYRLKSVYKSIGRMSNAMLKVIDNHFNNTTPNLIVE